MVSYRRLAMRVLGHVPVPFGKKKAAPPPRVAAQRIAALALACAMMTGMTLPAFAATYDIASGSIDIHATENGNLISQWFMNGEQKEYVSDSSGYIQDREDNDITITGTSTGNTVTIDADKDQTANVTLDNVEINASSTGQAAVDVTGSGNTNIELNGDNTLTGGNWYAGLQHNKETDAEGNETSGKLTITDTDNDGKLTATGDFGGAGIGGGNMKDAGKIEITGGSITATGGLDGAGIGGGGSGGDADITISGGTINAIGGTDPWGQPGAIGGAGIGGGGSGGNATVTITGGAVIEKASGGGCAGIGGGYSSKSDVTISGNATIEKATGGEQSAGIGGGGWKSTGTVTIQDNATIKNAQGGNGGAGIGGGVYGSTTVSIEGTPTIESTTGGNNGAGIGGGALGTGDVTIEGNVTIENAQGGAGAAGIGGGAETEPDTEDTRNKVSIKSTEAGSPNITATGGGVLNNEDAPLAGAAAIGSGSVADGATEVKSDITIEGKVTIDATAGGSIAKGDAIAIGDTPLQEKKFAGLPVGAVITRKDSDGVDLTQEGDKPTEPEKPEPEPEKPDPEKPNPEQPSEPSGAVSTSAPAEELTASDAEYLVTVEGLSVTNALEKQITHTCTQNVQGKVLTIRVNSIVATAHLTMETLRTLKAQGG